MEGKSPSPPPINLWLQEARAHDINGGQALEKAEEGTVTAAERCGCRIAELENTVFKGSILWPPSQGVSPW